MQVLHIDRIGPEAAAKAASIVLASGGIVLYPTDTLYGLAVDATNPKALERLYALKGRAEGKPVSVVVEDTEAMEAFATLTPATRILAERFLPGALTLVLPSRESVPQSLVHEGGVALCMPDDAFCLELARALKRPFTATSANLSGEPTLATIEEILAQFGDQAEGIALAIDDGPRDGGVPPTVVSCMASEPVILREGQIPASRIEEALV